MFLNTVSIDLRDLVEPSNVLESLCEEKIIKAIEQSTTPYIKQEVAPELKASVTVHLFQ